MTGWGERAGGEARSKEKRKGREERRRRGRSGVKRSG